MSKQKKVFFKGQGNRLLMIFALSMLFSISAFSQNNNHAAPQTIPADFKSDGCSHFPDGDYLDCCVEHDKAYFLGGSWKQRWRADKKLYRCVAAKKGCSHKLIAPLMWAGVRVFGVPFLPTSFRWGFGRQKTPKNLLVKPLENKTDLQTAIDEP